MQKAIFRPLLWLCLAPLVGFLWLPLTFMPMFLGGVGSKMASVLAFEPILYLVLFVAKAKAARKICGLPETGTIWALAILQVVLLVAGAVALQLVVGSLPEGHDWLDIGGHIA